jgi:hypothetical protein
VPGLALCPVAGATERPQETVISKILLSNNENSDKNFKTACVIIVSVQMIFKNFL